MLLRALRLQLHHCITTCVLFICAWYLGQWAFHTMQRSVLTEISNDVNLPDEPIAKPMAKSQNLACTPDDRTACWIGQEMLSHEGTFYHALKAKANADNIIILASVDEAFVELAYNYYETSLKPFNITNYLFICSDKTAVQLLEVYGLDCFLYIQDTKNQHETEWNTKDFKLKMRVKMKMITAALMLGFTAVLSDIDIVFIKDPTPKFKINMDVAFMSDVANDNCGFYIARPTKASILLHKKTLKAVMTRVVADQDAMAAAINEMKAKKLLQKGSLSTKEFPCGLLYYENGGRMFLTDKPCKGKTCTIYVVHNNWIVSLAAKIYRFKETGMWLYESDGYYSSKSRKYLQYSNPIDFGAKSKENERDALMSALTVARLLNRTLILPKFHCHGCKAKVCQIAIDHCAFNTHFNVQAFDQFFKNQYREHVFLMNPKVPKAIKESISPELVISTKNSSGKISPKHDVQFFTATSYDGGYVDPADVIKWFTTETLSKFSVLKFHSFYFAVKQKDKAWSDTLQKSLKWSNYRQLRKR